MAWTEARKGNHEEENEFYRKHFWTPKLFQRSFSKIPFYCDCMRTNSWAVQGMLHLDKLDTSKLCRSNLWPNCSGTSKLFVVQTRELRPELVCTEKVCKPHGINKVRGLARTYLINYVCNSLRRSSRMGEGVIRQCSGFVKIVSVPDPIDTKSHQSTELYFCRSDELLFFHKMMSLIFHALSPLIEITPHAPPSQIKQRQEFRPWTQQRATMRVGESWLPLSSCWLIQYLTFYLSFCSKSHKWSKVGWQRALLSHSNSPWAPMRKGKERLPFGSELWLLDRQSLRCESDSQLCIHRFAAHKGDLEIIVVDGESISRFGDSIHVSQIFQR